jgi:hypothetical protein
MGSTQAKTVAAVGLLAGFLLAGATQLSAGRAPTAQQEPRAVALSDLDFSVVSAPAVKRLTDSLRLAEANLTRLCARAGTPTYGKTGCAILVQVRRRFDELYGTQFTIKRDGPLVWFADGSWALDERNGMDSTTRCGKLHFADHSERLVYPPIRMWKIHGTDSVKFSLRGGNPLEQMCRGAFPGPGPTGFTAQNAGVDSIPVTWTEGRWISIGKDPVTGGPIWSFRPDFILDWSKVW